MRLKTKTFLTFFFFTLPIIAWGQVVNIQSPLSPGSDTREAISAVGGFIRYVATPLFVITLIVGGLIIMSAFGNPETLNKGKKFILRSTEAYIVILLIFGFVPFLISLIGEDLVTEIAVGPTPKEESVIPNGEVSNGEINEDYPDEIRGWIFTVIGSEENAEGGFSSIMRNYLITPEGEEYVVNFTNEVGVYEDENIDDGLGDSFIKMVVIQGTLTGNIIDGLPEILLNPVIISNYDTMSGIRLSDDEERWQIPPEMEDILF